MIFTTRALPSLPVFVVLVEFLHSVTSQCSLNGEEYISYEGPCTYNISASINLYTDNTYSEVRSAPYFQADETTDLFLQLKLISTERVGTNLLVEECYTTPNEDYLASKPEYIIRKPGCPYSNFQQIITISNNVQSDFVNIQFPIFFLEDGIDSFYIHCKIGACNCNVQCPKSPPSWTVAANISSIGPITRPSRNTDTGGDGNNNNGDNSQNVVVIEEDLSVYMYISAAVLALIIFAFLSLLTYICFDSKRRRGKFTPDTSVVVDLPIQLPRRPPPPQYESYVTQMERVHWRPPPPTPPPPFHPPSQAPPLPPPFVPPLETSSPSPPPDYQETPIHRIDIERT